LHADISIPKQESTETNQNTAGLWGLIYSIAWLLMCGCWLLTVPGLILSIIGIRKEPKTNATVGLVLSAIGIIAFLLLGPLILGLLLPAVKHGAAAAKVAKTQAIVMQHQALLEGLQKSGTHPKHFEELAKQANIDKDHVHDPWGNQYHIVQTAGKRAYVASAGLDGKIGTSDDVTPAVTPEVAPHSN